MLRLLARKADGWLPSFAWAKREGIAEGNAIIDAEATSVGRDPREIRRLINIGGRFQQQRTDTFHGPPAAWIDDILDLALDQGVSTFILASDDPACGRVSRKPAPRVLLRAASAANRPLRRGRRVPG